VTRVGWDRYLWGVKFMGSRKGDPPMLLGSGWAGHRSDQYVGESSRCLTFQTREQARAWCQTQRQLYATYPDGHPCRAWRFWPIRVRERVTEI